MVRFPWHRNGAVTDEPLAEPPSPPAERDSSAWHHEIAELKAELARIGEERQQLTNSAGSALLSGRGALVVDTQARLAALSTSEQIIQAAIAEAERHMERAQRREDREALIELERAYYGLLSEYCQSRARVRDAEANLVAVERAERGSVDQAQLTRMYEELLRARRAPVAAEEPEVRRRDAAGYRQDAERYRRRSGVEAAEAAVTVEVGT